MHQAFLFSLALFSGGKLWMHRLQLISNTRQRTPYLADSQNKILGHAPAWVCLKTVFRCSKLAQLLQSYFCWHQLIFIGHFQLLPFNDLRIFCLYPLSFLSSLKTLIFYFIQIHWGCASGCTLSCQSWHTSLCPSMNLLLPRAPIQPHLYFYQTKRCVFWCLKMLLRQVEHLQSSACRRVKWGVNPCWNLVCWS